MARLARASNLATCVSNVAVGVGLALGVGGGAWPWGRFVAAAGGVCLIYAGGVAVSDLADAGIDARHRPDRPIPSGRVGRLSAGVFAFVLAVVGLGLLACLGARAVLAGCVLVFAVMCYAGAHRWLVPAVVLMGVCRGLVYPVGYLAVGGDSGVGVVGVFAVLLGVYTGALTWLARHGRVEAGGGGGLLVSLVVVGALMVPAWRVGVDDWLWVGLAGLAMAAWLVYPVLLGVVRGADGVRDHRCVVQMWLAGFCLVDGFFLAVLDQPVGWTIAMGCFVLTVVGQRVLPGD